MEKELTERDVEEVRDILIAISVIAKRLSQKVETSMKEKEGN